MFILGRARLAVRSGPQLWLSALQLGAEAEQQAHVGSSREKRRPHFASSLRVIEDFFGEPLDGGHIKRVRNMPVGQMVELAHRMNDHRDRLGRSVAKAQTATSPLPTGVPPQLPVRAVGPALDCATSAKEGRISKGWKRLAELPGSAVSAERARRFDSRLWRMSTAECPICGRAGKLSREHVWPNWLLQQIDQRGSPRYAWSLNGTPLVSRDGFEIKGSRRQRVMLGICAYCNQSMSKTIETPAIPVVGPLALNEWRGTYTREQWRAVGRWWAKVLLLIGYPDSKLENPRLEQLVNWHFESAPDVRWLTDGTRIPNHLSAFIHRADLKKVGARRELIVPARVSMDDGRVANCHVMSLATQGMAVTVVLHPGMTIEHPLVASRDAWELIRSPPAQGDLGRLEPLPPDAVRFVCGGGVPEGHIVGDSETSRLTALFAHETD